MIIHEDNDFSILRFIYHLYIEFHSGKFWMFSVWSDKCIAFSISVCMVLMKAYWQCLSWEVLKKMARISNTKHMSVLVKRGLDTQFYRVKWSSIYIKRSPKPLESVCFSSRRGPWSCTQSWFNLEESSGWGGEAGRTGRWLGSRDSPNKWLGSHYPRVSKIW